MSSQKLDRVLFPIRIDRPLELELERFAEEMGLSKSEIVRASIIISIQERGKVEQTINHWKTKTDAWYEERQKPKESKESKNNNGTK